MTVNYSRNLVLNVFAQYISILVKVKARVDGPGDGDSNANDTRAAEVPVDSDLGRKDGIKVYDL